MASSDGDLSEIFKKSCNVGVSAKQGGKTTMTTANLTKWFKSCKIYGTKLTTTDTDIAFQKVKSNKTAKEITQAEFEKLLTEIAPKYKAEKKLGSNEEAVAAMKKKLLGGIDATSGTTKTSATGGVAKMTDTSQYTGSHKERFDASGKGKGLDGRVEKVDDSGYVGNYKGEGTYDKKH